MNTLDRYVAGTFFSSYLILSVVGIGFYIFADLMVNLNEFLEDPSLGLAGVLSLIADFYGHNLPAYYAQLSGPMMALAAAYTLAMMLRNSEMTALVAAGVPVQRLLAPIFACAVGLCVVGFLNQEFVIPRFAAKIARSQSDMINRQIEGVYCARDDNGLILTGMKFYPRRGEIENVYIVAPDAAGRPRELIEADGAIYDSVNRVWRLTRGQRLVLDDAGGAQLGGGVRYEPVDIVEYDLSPSDLLLRQSSQWTALMSLRQMNRLLQTRSLANRPAIAMARHVRVTTPILHLILLGLAASFFLSRQPGNVLTAGAKALAACGLMFAVAFVAHNLLPEASWAAVAVWVPIVLFLPFAVLRVANAPT